MTSSFDDVTAAEASNEGLNVTGGCRVSDRQLPYLPWNNPDNVISMETQKLVTTVLSVFVTSICTVGVATNVVNCIVYFKLGLTDRINLLLFSQAIADFVSCVYFFLVSVEYTCGLFLSDLSGFRQMREALTNSGATSMHGTVYVSGFISTFIACERCLCITSPFKAQKFLRTSTTGVAVAMVTVVFMGLHYLVSSKFKFGCEYVPAIRASISVHYPSEFYLKNSGFVDILNIIVFGLCLPFLFVITASITTVVTVVKLRRAVTWRQSSATVIMEAREVALTKMLVAVSCVFIVCTLPNVISRVTQLFVPDVKLGGRKQNIHMLGIGVVYLFNAINASINFFFYYKMGSRFREVLQSMCGRRSLVEIRKQLTTVTTK
ncbi:succinate receptor 1-like [Littorina saxatilis]|uniref:succinate receptor 1-like n=1 Tax=Littorina saxatilis TaxID=31220 RepID=UPI0038B5D325